MMESIINFIELHAQNAHWILFLLLLLSAFNLPISEDTILITAGTVSAIFVPEHTIRMILWVFTGSLLAAWITYWIGRTFGHKLLQYDWFSRLLNEQRLSTINDYLARYGLLTFMIIRFCPGGARNALFLTSGFTKMPFIVFALRDGCALLLSFSVLFSIGYLFGANLDLVLHYFEIYGTIILSIIGLIAVLLLIYYLIIKR